MRRECRRRAFRQIQAPTPIWPGPQQKGTNLISNQFLFDNSTPFADLGGLTEFQYLQTHWVYSDHAQFCRCYRGREHLSCIVAALLAEANSIKQDYADIVSVDYPNLKTLNSICQITPDRLTEHSKALQTFRERWVLLRKEYAARLECTNSVEESLRNMNLADMSYGADLVKSMVESFRAELTQVSMAQKDVLNLDDQMNAAEKAIELTTLVLTRHF